MIARKWPKKWLKSAVRHPAALTLSLVRNHGQLDARRCCQQRVTRAVHCYDNKCNCVHRLGDFANFIRWNQFRRQCRLC